MGWRFKQPINFGGFRINLSRRGLGFSWGFPMFRTGISADGRRYIWLTLPRTGLSWIKYFGKKPQSSPQSSGGHGNVPSAPTPVVYPHSPPATPKGSAPTSAASSSTPWWKQKNLGP